MKKIFTLFATLFCMACTTDMTEDVYGVTCNANPRINLMLGVDEQTRTSLNSSSLAITFNEGDAVEVNGVDYRVTMDAEGNPMLAGVVMADSYTAIFAGDHSFLASSDSNYKVSNMQRYVADSFDPEAMPMLAYATDDGDGDTPVSLNFKCLMGVMKLPVSGTARIRTIKVEDKAGSHLAGRMKLDNEDASQATCLVPTSSTATIPAVVMNCTYNNMAANNGVKPASGGTYFYIVMPAGTYANGLKVTISDSNQQYNTYSTSGSTTISPNVVTTMQPIAYAPKENLIMAEHFDACVYGGDIVRLRAGETTAYRGLTPEPQSYGAQSGAKAADSSTGFEPNIYYGANSGSGTTKEITPGSNIFSDWWNIDELGTGMAIANTDGKLVMSSNYIKSRGLWAWTLSRAIEYCGYIAVGNAAATQSTFGTAKTGSPQGDLRTPKLTKITSTTGDVVTLQVKIAAGAVNSTQNLRICAYNATATEFISAKGELTTIASSKISHVSGNGYTAVELPINAIPTTEWITFTVNVFGASGNTYFRFYTPDGSDGAKTATFFVDDIEVTNGTGAVVPSEDATVSGTVTCNGTGVAGVVVTDGLHFATTDESGKYYMNTIVGSADFIRVSVPSGYEAVNNAYYSKVGSAAKQTHNFTLKAVDQTNCTILTMADTHVINGHFGEYTAGKKDVELWAMYINKMKEYITTAKANGPVYAIHLGDMGHTECWHKYTLADHKAATDDVVGIPVFNTIGNHDHDADVVDGEDTFKSVFGPTYYSFNIGCRHFIILDNVLGTEASSSAGVYTATVSSDQLAWLSKDVACIDSSKITEIVVCLHIPLSQTSNKEDVFSRLAGYKFTVLGGHLHVDKYWSYSRNGMRVHEYVDPSGAGTNWIPFVSKDETVATQFKNLSTPDGVPASFVSYECNGTADMIRRVRPVAHTGNAAVYRLINTSAINSNSGSSVAYVRSGTTNTLVSADTASSSKAIMVNVWGATSLTATASSGSVTIENGRCDVYQRNTYVSWWNVYKKDDTIDIRDWHQPSKSKHVWVITPSVTSATITVTAKDMHGNVITTFTAKVAQ